MSHIYTGNGKGKTTAAFRAHGYGCNSYIGRLLKGRPYGELKRAERCPEQLTIDLFG